MRYFYKQAAPLALISKQALKLSPQRRKERRGDAEKKLCENSAVLAPLR